MCAPDGLVAGADVPHAPLFFPAEPDLPELADFAMARPAVTEFPDTVFVGHKHNDADSICSAIAAAHLYHGACCLTSQRRRSC